MVAVLVGTTAGFIVANSRDSSAGASVTLEPAGSVGKDPFSESVAIGPAAEFPGKVHAVVVKTRNGLDTDATTHTLIAVGTTPGLYGGSGDTKVCDPAKLVTFLHDNPSKALAWANVFGISTNQIAGYVAKLTPVVLTSDTLVTNHGYKNGRATPLQSVLQAGTAVMVDGTGTPRVKCNCGNPLAPPESISLGDVEVNGTPWAGYAPTTAVVVRPGTSTNELTLVNVDTGDTYTQPTGGGASSDYQGKFTIQTSIDQHCAPESGNLSGQTLTIRGDQVTITNGDGDYRGTLTQSGTRININATQAGSAGFTFTFAGTTDGPREFIGNATVHHGSASCAFQLTAQQTDYDRATADPSNPPCTREALQDAFSHDPEDDRNTAILHTPDTPHCVDGWATVGNINQGFHEEEVFRANGTGWRLVGSNIAPESGTSNDTGPLAAACRDGSIPTQLRSRACN